VAVEHYSAVVTTGIYCRPGCGARPDPDHVRPYASPAAAEAAGFRACLRCRPYRGAAPAVAADPDLVCRAVQLIVAGALDGGTENDLGRRLGVSARHLRRLFGVHVGVTPDALARSRRAHFARRLLDDTDLPVTDVAFAAGFGSVRQFNRAFLDVFRAPPRELRARRRKADRLVADGGLVLRVPYRGALDWTALAAYLAARAIPGVERVDGGTYRRSAVIGGDPAVIELCAGGDDHLLLRLHLPHWEGLIHIVERVRRLAGLDADLDAAHGVLRRDRAMRALVGRRPGLRVPGAWDPYETGVRAILGQQVSVAGASTLARRLVAAVGVPVPGLGPLGITHTFPAPDALAAADLDGIGLTRARAGALRAFAGAVAEDRVRLDRSVELHTLVASIMALPGLGPWTAQYIALRLGEPDAFPAGDLGLRRAFDRIQPGGAVGLAERAEAWRPWRALGAAHLWAEGAGG
jgi:AraC family transcriptional regulator of adaptative response / DNA-3-methyladenine glycosylase II